jgi:hypothetical protein
LGYFEREGKGRSEVEQLNMVVVEDKKILQASRVKFFLLVRHFRHPVLSLQGFFTIQPGQDQGLISEE